jgi:hypothetical protein
VQAGSTVKGLSLMCRASSNGKERFFFAAETKVMTCDIKSSAQSQVSDPISENHNSNVLLVHCNQDLEYDGQKYDALSLDMHGHLYM